MFDWLFKKRNKPNADELAEHRNQKFSPSSLEEFGVDGPLTTGLRCGKCTKVFYHFSETYVASLGKKMPCCPYCSSSIWETEMKAISQTPNEEHIIRELNRKNDNS